MNDRKPNGSGEFAIGFGDPVDIGLQQAAQIRVDQAFAEIQRGLAESRQAIADRVDACWAECRKSASGCVACLEGELDLELDNLKAVRNSIHAKINRNLDRHIGTIAGNLVSMFNELNPPAQSAGGAPAPIVAPDVRTLAREGETPFTLQPVDPYPPAISTSTAPPLHWPGGSPPNPFDGLPDSIGGIVSGDVTFNPPAGGGFVETPRDSIDIGGGIPSVPFCEEGVGHYELRDGVYQCIYPGGPGGGGTGGGGGGGSDTVGGGGGGGGDTCGPSGCGSDTVPATCKLPEGAWWTNPDDHSKGYEKPIPYSGRIEHVATPECIEKKTCPQCSPEKWIQPGDKDAVISAGELFPMPCDPANESVFESRDGDQEQTDKLIAGMQASQRKSFSKVYDESKGVSFIGKAILWAFGSIQSSLAYLAGEQSAFAAEGLPTPSGCDTTIYKSAVRMAALLSGMEKLFVFVPQHVKTNLQQKMNYACQFITPSPPELDLMRLRKCITANEWRFGMKIQGVCLDWAELNYKASTEYLPGPGDLIRFMMRDVFDPKAVEKLGLSEEFEDKFQGKAVELAERLGISRESMLREWQAHWNMLAPGQVYEMMHRLAPDQNAKAPDGTPVSFTPEDAAQLLKIADLPPSQINNLMAISYRPLAKRDARFLWATGTIDDDGLEKLFRQQGFSPENSKVLRDGAVKAWLPDKQKYQGDLTLAQVNKLFQSGSLSQEDYASWLLDAEFPVGDILEYVNRQVIIRKSADLRAVVGKLRTAYVNGRLSSDEYRKELQNAELSADRIDEIVARDAQIKRNSNKQIAIAKMCQLVGQGHMTMAEYLRRAVNLGYDQLDAALLAQSCNDDLVKRRDAEIQRDQRKALQEAEKAQRKAKQLAAEQRKRMRENFPCKPKAKPSCPAGVELPDYVQHS